MGISQQSLNITEAAINVISNNISNMNTDGYSRERVTLTPDINYTPLSSNLMGQAYSGSGVLLSNVERYTDVYLQSYFRQQNSNMSYYNQYKTVASSISQMTNELTDSAGLKEALTNFYAAANTLNQNPKSETTRNAFIQSASNLATQFNQVYKNLDDLQTNLVGKVNADGTQEGIESSQLSTSVTQVNSLLDQLTSINKDIVRTGSNGDAPNALLDKRDQIINQLSSYLPVTVTNNDNATVNISINGVNVITGTDEVGKLAIDKGSGTTATPSVIKLQDINSGKYISNSLNSYIDSGSIGGILTVTGHDSSVLTISGVLDTLNTLAKGFSDTMNDIQTKTETTTDASGKTITTTPLCIDNGATQTLKASTEVMFKTNDGSATITAGNITVNQKLIDDPFLIAAARTDVTASTYDVNDIGNNTNATEILSSRSKKLTDLSNSDFEDYLASFVGNVGIQAGNVNTKYTNQSTVLTQVKNQLSSVTGVDLNEEIVDLTKFQRQYQASARIFSVCNDLLGELVKLGE
jgi:flagellar hook-associated protein 1 FlgK